MAQENVPSGVAIKAKLIPESNPVFSVGAVGSGAMHDVRIDAANGAVLSNSQVGAGDDPCPGSVSALEEATAIAEARITGPAVQLQPDDDEIAATERSSCSRTTISSGENPQVQRDGAILEVELADDDD